METRSDLPDSGSADSHGAPTATVGALRYAAMSLLAMREHSLVELQRKLSRRYSPPQLIDTALQQLRAEGLQSDERFTEQFITARARRGQGPVRIKQELQQRGVDKVLAATCLDKSEVDWYATAAEVLSRKFGSPAKEMREKGKQMRFLQYRGFSHDHIQALWHSS